MRTVFDGCSLYSTATLTVTKDISTGAGRVGGIIDYTGFR